MPAATAPSEPEILNGEPLCDLDTAPQRPLVRIKTAEDREGKLYEMLDPRELGLEEEGQVKRKLEEFSAIAEKTKKSKAEEQRYKMLLDDLVEAVLPDTPKDVRELLTGRLKQQVVAHFTGALFAEDAHTAASALGNRLQQMTEMMSEARIGTQDTGN